MKKLRTQQILVGFPILLSHGLEEQQGKQLGQIKVRITYTFELMMAMEVFLNNFDHCEK